MQKELTFNKIDYSQLNSRQKEIYNYQKLSAILADYGFITHRLTDDWQGADLIAQHIDGETFLKIQLKGRLSFNKKYVGKEIYISFRSGQGIWYLFNHDAILNRLINEENVIKGTISWDEEGAYTFPKLSGKLREMLKPYKLN